MTFTIKFPRACTVALSITAMAMGLLPSIATAKPITTTDLLKNLRKGEPWDRGVFTATKTVMFQQAASGGTDATTVSKMTLSYFTSATCTGAVSGTGSYTTPNGTSYTISVGTPFGLVAASTWNVGSTKLSIADMTTIQSIAVTLKSTNSNTPQAAFTNGSAQVISYACIPVTCTAGPSGECTSGSGTQSFTLKTTAAVGDPADGGVIGCQNTGTSFNLFNIVVTTSDQSTSQGWGDSGTTTTATSTTDGAANTATIVAALGTGTTYAARTCNELSVRGGFTSGWFLPSGAPTGNSVNQLNCLYNNRTAIATGSAAAGGSGFASTAYWSSTEFSSTYARLQDFINGNQASSLKIFSRGVRCSRAF
jgi:hypothetical protein